ncbi:MAG: HAD hydrolase-like protein [Clostridia bacterium]|nr:HAD hydrolase-like protein [Clostridia bacterium]
MKIKAVLFDLDGTLLPMDQDTFVSTYFAALADKLASYGYDKETLVAVIWKGMKAMMKNTTEERNETLFWREFSAVYGNTGLCDSALFDEFYEKDFPKVRRAVGFAPEAKQTVSLVKALGYRAVLATNPMFPKAATYQRVGWAGLSLDDFEMISTYEDFTRCKPNPEYFTELLGKLGLSPDEVVMVGNDAYEDMAAAKLGIPVFLLTHSLVNRKEIPLDEIPHGGFDELAEWLKSFG